MEKGICTTINHGSDGFEHVIVCLTTGGEMEDRLPEGVPVISMGKRPGNSFRFLAKLAGVFRRLRPDVVHTRNWVGLDGVFAARMAGIRGVVHGEHGWGVADPFGRNKKRRYVRMAADMGVQGYTCVSAQMKTWLENHIRVRKPVTQIYNGIDTQKFRPAEKGEKAALRERLGLGRAAPVVGVVARLDPIKNHRCLFDAFEMLKPRFPGLTLLVVGDGPERAVLKKHAGDGVRFLGQRSDTEDIYRTMDLFVLPSSNEGISNTILEAMASGLPVIAGRVGGNPELIHAGENGTLFSPESPKSLAEKMRHYLENPEITSCHGQEARSDAVSRFTVPKMVTAYEDVWKDTRRRLR